jgi:hypothetical protein
MPQLAFRVPREVIAQLDTIADRRHAMHLLANQWSKAGTASRSVVAREALELGLRILLSENTNAQPM